MCYQDVRSWSLFIKGVVKSFNICYCSSLGIETDCYLSYATAENVEDCLYISHLMNMTIDCSDRRVLITDSQVLANKDKLDWRRMCLENAFTRSRWCTAMSFDL